MCGGHCFDVRIGLPIMRKRFQRGHVIVAKYRGDNYSCQSGWDWLCASDDVETLYVTASCTLHDVARQGGPRTPALASGAPLRSEPHFSNDNVPHHCNALVCAAIDQSELNQASDIRVHVLVISLKALRKLVD